MLSLTLEYYMPISSPAAPGLTDGQHGWGWVMTTWAHSGWWRGVKPNRMKKKDSVELRGGVISWSGAFFFS